MNVDPRGVETRSSSLAGVGSEEVAFYFMESDQKVEQSKDPGSLEVSKQPLVSVLTPVYNGECYLAECIESVIKQTYQNWEYIIVNNCSSDRTLKIASDYARRDSRIRIVNNSEFVSVVKNHNTALVEISSSSKYCKFIQADDVLFPTCLAEMVKVAEAHPSVGIVSSYQLWGDRVEVDGLPYPSTVVPGREVCRTYFLERRPLFGTMGNFLLRSEIVRSRPAFLNEQYLFADWEVYFEVLQDHDYGFVHQVLSVWRTGERGLTSFAKRHNEWILAELYFTKEYGHIYLSKEEQNRCLNESLNRYYRCQAHELFHLRESSFWQHHRRMLQGFGLSFSRASLLNAAMLEVVDVLLAPIKSFRRPFKIVRENRGQSRQNGRN